MDKKALKARLLKRYAAQLDDLLEQLDENQRLHLTEIENLALKLRQDTGQSITEELTRTESQQPIKEMVCPTCQQPMRYKGHKQKWLKTRTGEVQVERPYYYCDSCRSGHFPPG